MSDLKYRTDPKNFKTYNDGIQMDAHYIEEVNNDAVEKPFHYNYGKTECIDYVKQVLGHEGLVAYCRGNAIKYNHRAGYKTNKLEDLQKAEWYLKRAIKELGGEN